MPEKFRGLFFVTDADKFLGELEDAPEHWLTHRQEAVKKALESLCGDESQVE